MALSDLSVYSEYAYTSMTEVLRQQIDLFNAASDGVIILGTDAVQGDYSDKVLWAKISGLVRRRDAYGTGTVSEKVMTDLVDTMVKIAAGTPPVRLDPGQFKWIQKNPEEAGVVLGQQLAKDFLADMLNTALGAGYAALGQISSVVTGINVTSAIAVASTNLLSLDALNTAQSKFGDASSSILAWVMHSKPIFDLYAKNIANAGVLFNYGNVNVSRDPFGKLFIITDSPSLFYLDTVPNPDANVYPILGLTSGALTVTQNNDFTANESTLNGNENITRTYQAEWSYNLGVKGFKWDKTNGSKSPTDAALFTATNWDRYATSDKDLAGVVLKVN